MYQPHFKETWPGHAACAVENLCECFIFFLLFHPLYLQVKLNEVWKKKYEDWLEIEVFSRPHDWDSILSSTSAFMDVKAMEF